MRATAPVKWGVSGFTEEDWQAAGVALPAGCQSLLKSLEVLDQHFSLGITQRLGALSEMLQILLMESITAEEH